MKKKNLASPPLLSLSKPNKELYFYLIASPTVVSSTLIRKEAKVQIPVYYTSRAQRGAEDSYPPMEKLAFALVIAAHKLRLYFQTHKIVASTDKPLKKATNNPEAAL